MNFIIDIGNSFIKLSVFKEDNILYMLSFKKTEINSLIHKLNSFVEKTSEKISSILSSVSEISPDLEYFLKKKSKLYINLDDKPDVPIEILYKTPATLGSDRLAAVVAANNIFPNTNVLVFDAGTALTIDFINSKNQYEGGNISPGIFMRFKALNKFTEKLPIIKPDKDNKILIGKSTNEAILSGVQNGIMFEVDGYIDIFKQKYSNLKVVFTGGDIFFFENKLKNKIFAEKNLVLKGLNIILKYNANKN